MNAIETLDMFLDTHEFVEDEWVEDARRFDFEYFSGGQNRMGIFKELS